ncbi:MAG TPA: N-acetyl-gamma-glutamyl-phosphate reductase [Bacillota bacterium]|nr:N-acetyl-gamma-glutamyl-phosphate reductase [Bacillota bacterium]HRS20387.1 N-acetyl-gamma-glutamyl-phosphate reductase [Clostridia bacterium]HRU40433.1 N-acetyl-gamma-glutamyl-phosphate reductase [Candidatus Diapherotrites archaeon]HOS69132.1 N-acetyl-gamma-glutamyl-phosphate reductase [Bacillota bacterium]HQE66509.1 N-acetyl-gamma-glutamyl-phosphate reductase [Bacillota bacterium]
MVKVGIVGSTGYAGYQLSMILSQHKNVSIVFLSSHNYSNMRFSDVYGNLKGLLDNICIDMQDIESKLSKIDVLFLALPHGQSFDLVEKALSLGVKVIDIGADYRLRDQNIYEKWYGVTHKLPGLLKDAAYGLPELYRDKISNSSLVANPGCYPTASILALAPLVHTGVIDNTSIIIDAKSGVSGAGRSANMSSLFCECGESVKAYNIATHRHTPEIEQQLSDAAGEKITLSFTPHLVPMSRGILATCYGSLKKDISQNELYDLYRSYYKNENFIRITDSLPETRYVRGSNICDIAVRVDERTNRVIAVSAIDNLIKGAAGQAVQNMNILFGLYEHMGLDMLPNML